MGFWIKDAVSVSPAPQAGDSMARRANGRCQIARPLISNARSGHRFYSPSLGRWGSRDPIGEWGGLNRYSLLGNDAIDDTDLLGMFDWHLFNDADAIYAGLEGHGPLTEPIFPATSDPEPIMRRIWRGLRSVVQGVAQHLERGDYVRLSKWFAEHSDVPPCSEEQLRRLRRNGVLAGAEDGLYDHIASLLQPRADFLSQKTLRTAYALTGGGASPGLPSQPWWESPVSLQGSYDQRALVHANTRRQNAIGGSVEALGWLGTAAEELGKGRIRIEVFRDTCANCWMARPSGVKWNDRVQLGSSSLLKSWYPVHNLPIPIGLH